MDENPINPSDKTPETEPVAAPDENNNDMPSEPVEETGAVPEAGASETETVEEPAPTPEPATPEPTPAPGPEPVSAPVPESISNIPTQPVMEPAPKKKSHKGLIILTVVAIALVAAGVVICLMLLNNKPADNSSQNKPETPVEQPTENPDSNKEVSTVSCEASGNTWNYASSITVNNKEQKTTKIINSLKLSDNYNADDLTEDEAEFLTDIAFVFSVYGDMEDEGVKVTSEGDFETGAGFSSVVEIDRDKAKSTEILEMFESVDGMSASKIAEDSQSASAQGIVPTCTVK